MKGNSLWKILSPAFFHLSVSSLFCVSLYISPKKFPKNDIFQKVNT